MASSVGNSTPSTKKRKLWEESPNTFTEFGALSSDVKSGGFFSRFWKKKDTDDQVQSNPSASLSEDDSVSISSQVSDKGQGVSVVDGKVEKSSPVARLQRGNSKANMIADGDTVSIVSAPAKLDQSDEVLESQVVENHIQHRTLSSVLSRLGSIIDQRSTTPQTYKDSDFKQYWMPDSSCRECYDCGDKFTMFLRRHHCRICGLIFCSKCCNQELPGKIIGYKGGIRVCTYCCRVVQTYAQQSASTGDFRALDLRAISRLYSESQNYDFGNRSLSPRVTSCMDDLATPLRGESLPDLPGLAAPDLTTPFDLTPQSEFSSQESLLLESKLLIQDSVQLRELWRQICDAEAGVEMQTLRIRLRTHQNCIVGKELVDWLIKYDKAATRDQAIAIGQALLYAGYLDLVGNQQHMFRDDFTLYRHGEAASTFEMKREPEAMPTITEELEKNEPLWFQEISKSNGAEEVSTLPEDFSLNVETDGHKSTSSESDSRTIFYINESSHSGSFSEIPKFSAMKDIAEEPLPIVDTSVPGPLEDFLKGDLKTSLVSTDLTCPHGWRSVDQLREENGERLAYERLKKAHTELWHVLTRQLLSQHGLLLGWEPVISTSITQVSHFVRPDVRHEMDNMDIRNYVHIKKVPGGNKNDTTMFHGVIFTKNVAHKKMRTKVVNPLILLLQGTIEFQRVENKFSSLEPQILQEREFMRNSVMKMIAYRPNVVVVEKSVSRLAQEHLLEAGITLLYNVKPSVMERLARFTQADIVPSIDGLVKKPKMGFCHDFRVQTYNLPNKETKTLAIFDGCATHLGCTIVLRGGVLGELRRVKHILKFMTYTAYNSLLELCFCMDEFALPQPGADEIGQPFEGLENSMEKAISDSCRVTEESVDGSKSQDDQDEIEDSHNMWMDESDSELEEQMTSSEVNNVKDSSGNNTETSSIDDKYREECYPYSENKDIFSNESLKHKSVHQGISQGGSEGLHEAQSLPVQVINGEREREAGSDSGKRDIKAIAELCLDVTDVELNLPDEDYFGKDGAPHVLKSGPVRENTSTAHMLSSQEKVRHCSGVSTASVGHLSDTMSGRSTPDYLNFNDGLWDGSPKVVANIVCIIPKSSIPTRLGIYEMSLSHELSNSKHVDTEDQKQKGSIDVSDNNHCHLSSVSSSSDIQSSDVSQVDHRTTREQETNMETENSTLINKVADVIQGLPTRSTTSKLTELTDFSDPLLGYQNTQDESIFQAPSAHKISLKEIKQTRYKRFRKALDGVHLSISPYHKYNVPFIETDKGSRCSVRKYLPEDIFWSSLFDGEAGQSLSRSSKFIDSDPSARYPAKNNIEIVEHHALITCKLTEPIRENETQKLLADFRARGGRIHVLEGLSSTKQNQTEGGLKKSDDTGLDFNGLLWEKKIDCLDPVNHQKLMVLFSSYSYKSSNHPQPCVYPWIVTMEFYGRNDITLGAFLERFCFRKQYVCPSATCERPMADHIRRFVHGNACINLLLKKHDNEDLGAKENILMWSWCKKCKHMTPVVPISNDTWSLSFAKYLDLRFHSTSFWTRGSSEVCTHSLHHDYHQYFGHRNIVASFRHTYISLKELSLPPTTVTLHPPTFDVLALSETVKEITYRATERYSLMLESMMKLKQEFTSETQTRAIADILAEQQIDKKNFRDSATNIQMKIQELIHSVTVATANGSYDCDMTCHLYSIFDNIVLLKRKICEDIMKWNSRVQEFMSIQQKKSKPPAAKKDRDSGASASDELEKSMKVGFERSTSKVVTTASSGLPQPSPLSPPGGVVTITLPALAASPPSAGTSATTATTTTQESSVVNEKTDMIIPTIQCTEVPCVPMSALGQPSTAAATSGQQPNTPSTPLVSPVTQHSTPLSSTLPTVGSQSLLAPMEEIEDSTDGWFQELKGVTRRLLSTSSFVPISLPFELSEHHTLPMCERVPIIIYDGEPSSIIAYALSSSEYRCCVRELHNATRRNSSDPNLFSSQPKGKQGETTLPLGSGGELTIEAGRKSGGGVLSFLRGSSREPSPSPHHTSAHHRVEAVRYIPGSDWGDSGSHLDDVDASILSDEATPSPEEKPKVGSTAPSPHIELQFSDSSAKFYCRVYFADQFRKLRKHLFQGNDNLFIRSLSRCKTWEAKGGKSGLSFCKTDDDRFILKQMSNMEVDSFEKFGPQYFQYITTCTTAQQPTALAKILGVFRIGFRNSQTNTALRQDVLIMENLFYNRKISQKFDLKGSMRNRLVNTATKRAEEELVLLDENLLKSSVESPLYLRPHSKYVLKSAITSDSTFLSSNLVMDYSLLVGVDETTQEMVVGIIDYIRTFTWDKKLEMVVKASGILGGQGKMPTVVSPQLYKSRFLEAMDRYFLHVPDHWTGLGQDAPTCPTTIEVSEAKQVKK
ncbi:1-phosphatidylinositol 3-phosphate 5-kinase [Biomphalaria pfeifferi]|uniref:1-phosphatidylinositol 3-phosphate 5-kinase n=1 Tax=Biomphalaria pfeifferi TaxID=112525 RepID=A0AAD8ASR3_BIOPF|nr:1-phosphatidylinositol 3-phosphate 5-kinase [Biomphalaria pfeifferi]